MLRLLIPIISIHGAVGAARHAAFLSGKHRGLQVELLEVLEPPDQCRVVAFHSIAEQCSELLEEMSGGVRGTQAVLENAGVPFTLTRRFGPAAQTTAAFAAELRCDIVLLDASHLGPVGRWWLAARLWRLTPTPVTQLHEDEHGKWKWQVPLPTMKSMHK